MKYNNKKKLQKKKITHNPLPISRPFSLECDLDRRSSVSSSSLTPVAHSKGTYCVSQASLKLTAHPASACCMPLGLLYAHITMPDFTPIVFIIVIMITFYLYYTHVWVCVYACCGTSGKIRGYLVSSHYVDLWIKLRPSILVTSAFPH